MFSTEIEIDHTEDFVATVHYKVEPQQTAVRPLTMRPGLL